MLKIVEIFYSIQGEGRFSGYPCVFVRLHGCNLDCHFCDELLHKGNYEDFTYKEVIEKINKYPTQYVVITGGEPSLNDINKFINELHKEKLHIAVETNGYMLENIKSADHITYSPKQWNNLHVKGFSEYKFIIEKRSDINQILSIKSKKPIYIQPMNYKDKINEENTKHCIELVKKHPCLKLSVQLHKYLGVE